jgi:hypothetical protein
MYDGIGRHGLAPAVGHVVLVNQRRLTAFSLAKRGSKKEGGGDTEGLLRHKPKTY